MITLIFIQLSIQQVVQEKQRQMRLFLINMNIGNIIHFICWYCKGLVYMLISSILIMGVVKVRRSHKKNILDQTRFSTIRLSGRPHVYKPQSQKL